MQKWWLKYDNRLDEGTLESIAKKYWEMYIKITTTAEKNWVIASNEKCNGRYIPKKMVKADEEYAHAMRLAQPLLEDWVEICQKLNRVIR